MVKLPNGKKVWKNKWVYRIKYQWYKARLVVKDKEFSGQKVLTLIKISFSNGEDNINQNDCSLGSKSQLGDSANGCD
jgi:hypothetical protein